jgi:hypothetical protein
MRHIVWAALVVGCWTSSPTPIPPALPSGLVLEVSPAELGARPPGSRPTLTVTLVNRSATRTFSVPRPGVNAWLGLQAPLRFTFERARADGTWEPLPMQFFSGHPRRFERPGRRIVLGPGERTTLTAGIPPLEFPDDHVGRLRARLIYDITAEVARLPRTDRTDSIDPIVSNPIQIEQLPGPLELVLEQIAPLAAGASVDASQILRVTVRNRTTTDRTLYGPGGTTAGIGFEIDRPNGGKWPIGDGPVTSLAPEPARPRVLRRGEAIEIFGRNPALGRTPSRWTYPVAETIRIRAILSQPGPGPRLLYSSWVTITTIITTP